MNESIGGVEVDGVTEDHVDDDDIDDTDDDSSALEDVGHDSVVNALVNALVKEAAVVERLKVIVDRDSLDDEVVEIESSVALENDIVVRVPMSFL